MLNKPCKFWNSFPFQSARFIKRLSNKNSFDGIWFLTFIIYKFTADSCFDILRCEKLYGVNETEYVRAPSRINYCVARVHSALC